MTTITNAYADDAQVRLLALGDSTDDTHDAAFAIYAPQVARDIDNILKKYRTVPLTGSNITADVVKANNLGTVLMFYLQTKSDQAELIKQTGLAYEEALKKIVEGYDAVPPTSGTESPEVASASYSTPLIDESYWDGTNSDVGPGV